MERQLARTPRRENSKRSWISPKNTMRRVAEAPAGGQRPAKPIPDGCICQRPKRLVLCSVCGFQIIGRVRTVCPAHPQTIFLMDLERCPQCLGYSLILREFPIE